MRKIYLACPYSDENLNVCEWRTVMADRAAAKLMEKGNAVFSPISHSHRIAHHIKNHLVHSFWLDQDLTFFVWADELNVFQLPEWDNSTGVNMEVGKASEMGIPVKYINPYEMFGFQYKVWLNEYNTLIRNKVVVKAA
ncbi:MAG: DUF1937 family protein [bacterium]